MKFKQICASVLSGVMALGVFTGAFPFASDVPAEDTALAASVCEINVDTEYQVIKGFGGMNNPEWIGDLTDAQRKTAFGNGSNELGLTVCRVFINEDKNQWYRALATAKYAQSQGAIVFASPWNPPDSMCETFSFYS